MVPILQAEELIKREMIVMQRYDGLHDPVPGTSQMAMQQYQSYLDTHPYQQVQQHEMEQVRVTAASRREHSWPLRHRREMWRAPFPVHVLKTTQST